MQRFSSLRKTTAPNDSELTTEEIAELSRSVRDLVDEIRIVQRKAEEAARERQFDDLRRRVGSLERVSKTDAIFGTSAKNEIAAVEQGLREFRAAGPHSWALRHELEELLDRLATVRAHQAHQRFAAANRRRWRLVGYRTEIGGGIHNPLWVEEFG